MGKSRLSWYKQSRLIEHFVSGSTARTAAKIVHVNKTTSAFYFHRLREVIYQESLENIPFDGEIEVDESYFGGVRKGRRGRGAAGKVPVFGILKRGGKVYTQVIPDAKGRTLMPIMQSKIRPDSIVYTDGWKGYNILDVSEFRHWRINHSKAFVQGRNHINGIENFWNQAKRHMRKFNGIPKKNFHLFLKECEWQFNHSDLSMKIKQLKQWAKQHLN